MVIFCLMSSWNSTGTMKLNGKRIRAIGLEYQLEYQLSAVSAFNGQRIEESRFLDSKVNF